MVSEENIRYQHARHQVKKMKGFYIHLIVFVAVNVLFIVDAMAENGPILDSEIYITTPLWAIGLVVHGISVFSPNFIFGKKWEARKIEEIMRRNQQV